MSNISPFYNYKNNFKSESLFPNTQAPAGTKISNSKIWRRIRGQGLLSRIASKVEHSCKMRGGKRKLRTSAKDLKNILNSSAVKQWGHVTGRGLIADSLRKVARKYDGNYRAAPSQIQGKSLRNKHQGIVPNPAVGKRRAVLRKKVVRAKVGATGFSHGKGYRAERFNPTSAGLDMESAHKPFSMSHMGPRLPKGANGTANLPTVGGAAFRKPNKTVIGNFTPGIGALGVGAARQANAKPFYDASGLYGNGLIAGYGGV